MEIKLKPYVKLGISNYRLRLQRNLREDLGFRGVCDNRRGLISIEPLLENRERSVILIHEMLEQVEPYYGLDLEDVTRTRIASIMAEFIYDNLDIELDWSDIPIEE